MIKQITLSELSDNLAETKTKKKEFLNRIDRIVPWDEWLKIIEPHYYKGERGNKPYDKELMLRLYLLQNLYNLSDMQTAEQVIDSRAFSDFCSISSPEEVPDGDTIGRFRNLLIKAGVQEMLFAQVITLLRKKDLILKKGTIVDSTIISAPSSTKNKEHKRDPEAHSVKKGNEWKFGYKAHVGVDSESGLVHSLEVTSANVHDVTITSKLLSGEEEFVYGDSGYIGAEKRENAITHNNHGKKLYTESIVNQVRSNVFPKVASTRLKRKNAKNLLFELKLNMSSLLSKIFSLFVKLDIEANESNLLN